MDLVVNDAIEYVRSFFEGDFTGHDFSHTMRVFSLATKIAKIENARLQIVQLAALLHDVDDRKLSPHTTEELINARTFLKSQNLDESVIEHICHIITQVSFKGKDSVTPDTIEGMCVQDADRLDALGAVGIARAFAYGGANHRAMYDPLVPPAVNMSEEEYFQSKSTTLNHFYEKLFLLKDMMNTPTARYIAEKREEYMKGFVERFLFEWEGKS